MRVISRDSWVFTCCLLLMLMKFSLTMNIQSHFSDYATHPQPREEFISYLTKELALLLNTNIAKTSPFMIVKRLVLVIVIEY